MGNLVSVRPSMGADAYVRPRLIPAQLDTYAVRTAILRELKRVLPRLSGVLLDVGCGNMPYRSLVLAAPSGVSRYIGLDLKDNAPYVTPPDLVWNGVTIPLGENSVDCVLCTEVLEHCKDPTAVLRELHRVLKPDGLLFFTVPFLWPLHDAPHDEYRYTPFAMERLLREAGLGDIELRALGGWDASLAQMIGLWVRRRGLRPWKRALLSRLLLPVVRRLAERDRIPGRFHESLMITGMSGIARKPGSQ